MPRQRPEHRTVLCGYRSLTISQLTRPSLILGVLVVGLGALLPWYHTHSQFPDEPFDVSVLYRGHRSGDIQYFPLIAQLAHGSVTDGSVKEQDGTLLLNFPHATMLPHAMGVAALGPYGFPAADVVVAVCYFLLLVALLRTMGVSWTLSAVIGCCLALHLPVRLTAHLTLGPVGGEFPVIPSLWGLRIPRPFVAELFLVAGLLSALRLLTTDRSTWGHWLLLAVSFGLQVQGDLHGAMIYALASPCVLFCLIRREGLSRTLRHFLLFGLILAAVIAPFVVQRLAAHPDIAVRWGVMDMDRLAGFKIFWRQLAEPALVVALVIFTGLAYQLLRADEDYIRAFREAIQRVWWLIFLLPVAAFSCLPISVLLLGKAVQPYHFSDRAERICGYLVIVLVAVWFDTLIRSWMGRITFPGLKKFAEHTASYGAMLALVVCVCGYWTVFSRASKQSVDPVRRGYYAHVTSVEPSYREAFAELTEHLRNEIRPDAVVAGFDHQVFSWWLTFSDGYWFLVEPFVSSIPDDELETRLSLLCRVLGMSSDDYIRFIQTPREGPIGGHGYVNTFWLGLAKYQASRIYTFAPLDDYTEEQQQAILASDYVWQKFIPQGELSRLKRRYDEVTLTDLNSRALDVIVLSNTGPEKQWTPSEEFWELTFRNGGFRVFTKSVP